MRSVAWDNSAISFGQGFWVLGSGFWVPGLGSQGFRRKEGTVKCSRRFPYARNRLVVSLLQSVSVYSPTNSVFKMVADELSDFLRLLRTPCRRALHIFSLLDYRIADNARLRETRPKYSQRPLKTPCIPLRRYHTPRRVYENTAFPVHPLLRPGQRHLRPRDGPLAPPSPAFASLGSRE